MCDQIGYTLPGPPTQLCRIELDIWKTACIQGENYKFFRAGVFFHETRGPQGKISVFSLGNY